MFLSLAAATQRRQEQAAAKYFKRAGLYRDESVALYSKSAILGHQGARGALNPGVLTREAEDKKHKGFRRFFREGFKEFLKRRYGIEIGELLGEGTFGAVYEVVGFPERCVKIVHLSSSSGTSHEETIDKFKQETEVATSAGDDGFGPTYYRSFVHPVEPRDWIGGILMERMQGDCSELPRDATLANAINKQVPDLLRKMAFAGVDCLDLKLENLLYKRREGSSLQLKFGDFGLCSHNDESDKNAVRLAMGLMFAENVGFVELREMLSELTEDLSGRLTPGFLDDFMSVHEHYHPTSRGVVSKIYFDELVKKYTKEYTSRKRPRAEVIVVSSGS